MGMQPEMHPSRAGDVATHAGPELDKDWCSANAVGDGAGPVHKARRFFAEHLGFHV